MLFLSVGETSSWQRKGSVSLHYKTLLDYSVNLEPKILFPFSLLCGHGPMDYSIYSMSPDSTKLQEFSTLASN